MGFLKQLDVENFKSWGGKQVIGPFMRFNCIIGTNGSGKSNVMDALSFAMGERIACLRVRRLSELIHGAHVGRPASNCAQVALSYCAADHDDDDDVVDDKIMVFCRRIQGESSEYYVDADRVSHAKYMEELEKIGIVTKAQNCLVFQGTVEAIAMKHAEERTKMLECICQSRQLAAEYERKKEALHKAKEETQFNFNRRKAAISERKQMFQEKEEAEKYQALVDDVQRHCLQLMLAELYRNEKSIDALSSARAEKQLEATAKKDDLVHREEVVKADKKQHRRLYVEQQLLEKEMRAQEHALSQCRSQYVKAKVNFSHHRKKVEEHMQALRRGQKLLEVIESGLEEERQEMAQLEKAWRRYEKEVQEKSVSGGGDIELDRHQLQRYNELKELSLKQSAVLGQQAEKLDWKIKADHEQLALDQRRKNEVEAANRTHKTQLEDLIIRAEKVEEYTKTCSSFLVECRGREESLSAELERGRRRSEEVNQELAQVLEELGNARLDRHDSRLQLQRKELLEKLCRLFPDGVYGRLSDLCTPIHRMYHLAVTKVFGRYMNAIVVATEKVARDCISFVKEERAERETFLPIDYLDVSPLNERLRELPNAKLLMDVVQVSGSIGALQLRKVLQFVCGNTLLCNTIADARGLAFDRQERHKTVSLDGTLFSKSGVISGGSSDLQTKARRWGETAVAKLKDRKEKLTAELRDLMKLRRKESELNQVITQAQGANTRLKYSGVELENLRQKNIVRCEMDISRMEQDLADLEAKIQQQQQSVETKEAAMVKIREEIAQISDVVFRDFCAETGLSNIREYEQEHLKQQTELEKKRFQFKTHCDRLNTQVEYNQSRLEQEKKKCRKIEENVKKEERTADELKKVEQELLQAVDEAQEKLQEQKQQLREKETQMEATKAEVEQETKSIQGLSRELAKLQLEQMSVESALEQKRLARHNLLLDCKIRELPVTLLSGDLAEISKVQLDRDSESTLNAGDIYEREAQMTIDYSALTADVQALREEDMESYIRRRSMSLAEAEGLLQHTTVPNLKALEDLWEVNEVLQEANEAFESSTKAARKCSQEFEQVKSQRLQLFVGCLDHVSTTIDRIYKRICRNNSAQAVLSPDNPDEPYLGGIAYSCVAPGKRFMTMENLSGGEKCIAALALLFAIHSYCPAPFFVLDEVDAALDNSNISKVTSFLREESRRSTQIIAISLKEEFFSSSDALLGVYSGSEEYMMSRIITLDLRPYPLEKEEREWRSSKSALRG